MKYWLNIGLVFCLTFLVVGEIDFRWLPHQQRLDYEVDDALLWRLSPNQKGFEWLAQMSLKSPPIHINSLGYRGQEPKENIQAKILAVGSSSTLGTGVAEGLVWHQRLQEQFTDIGYDVTVFNGANPGWGPFQHAAFLEQELRTINPDLLLVFINHQDLQFKPKSSIEKQKYLEKAKARKELLSISPFITYCLRKVESFISPLRRAVNDLVRPPANSSQTLDETLEVHKRSWFDMIQLAEKHKLPLVYFIPNLLNDPKSIELELYLRALAKAHPLITVHALTTRQNLSDDQKRLLEHNYLIANDGHPNASYHQAMADDLLVLFINSQLAAYLSNSPSLTLKSELVETS